MTINAKLALVGGRVLGLGGDFSTPRTANLLIEGERIASVGPEAPPADAQTIDVAGLTVLPGMVELHTHPPLPSAMALFVRQGITSVRFAGTPLGAAGGLRQQVQSGAIPGPRIFSCGPILDEPPAAWRETSIELAGPEDARAVVDRVVEAEADALIVTQRMRPATIAAVVEAAHARGVPVTGQNWTSSVREAVRVGMDGVENTARLPESPAADQAWVEAYSSIGHRLARLAWLWRTAPQGPIDDVLALMAERGVDWAPEICSFAFWAGFTDGPLSQLPAYVPPPPQEQAAIDAQRARCSEGWTDEDRDNTRAAIERIKQAVLAYQRLGGPLGVGTDAHPGGLFYHLELGYYAQAGLTNAEVIRAATVGGARALRRADQLGTLDPGKLADLIVVDGDPLADLAALQRVRHTLVSGRQVYRSADVADGRR